MADNTELEIDLALVSTYDFATLTLEEVENLLEPLGNVYKAYYKLLNQFITLDHFNKQTDLANLQDSIITLQGWIALISYYHSKIVPIVDLLSNQSSLMADHISSIKIEIESDPVNLQMFSKVKDLNNHVKKETLELNRKKIKIESYKNPWNSLKTLYEKKEREISGSIKTIQSLLKSYKGEIEVQKSFDNVTPKNTSLDRIKAFERSLLA